MTGSIVPGRPFLPKRLVVLFAITAALLTCAALTTSASHARADIPVENIIVQSGEDELLPGANPTVVYLNESNEIRLENPGLSVPLPPGCTPVGGTDRRTVCIGEGGKETIDGTPVGKGVTILGGNRYGVVGLPSLEHLIDEAVTILMARHEIDNREMVLKYARGEIRAYLYARINEILDKRLYGEPMTPQELETYRSVAAFFTAEEQRIGREIHRQYLAWKSDPCGWVPPKPPPGSNLPVVPNRTASTAACVTPHLQANLWRITNNTPTVDEFKHWAVYADPTIPVLLTGDPDHVHEMRSMVTATIALSSLGAAAGAGLTAGAIVGSSIGITKAFISTVVGTVGLVLKNAAAANLIALGTATAASSASVVVITAAIIAVASIQFAEDTAIPEEINRIAEEADSLTDRLGIETHRPDYADLDFETREQPANQEQVPWVKSEEFQTSLLANVIGWTTFDVVSGQYLNDPVDGYNSVPATTDAKFKVNGVDNVGYLELRSPTGTPDFAGRATDAYRVHLKDGWLMTSSRNPNNGQWRQPVPRLTLPFIQADGTNGILSIVRVDDTRKFQVTTVPVGDGEATAELLDNVTFKLPSGTNAIAAFQPKPRRIPRVGVLPTVDGEMLPGHLLTFRSNPTDDTYDGDLDIGWTVERFNDDGEVVETIVENNVVAFQKRLSAPGPYRATVAFSLVSGGDIYEGSGSVDFRVEIPTPLIDGEVRIHPDDPTQRHLAIEIEQQSPGAVFNVEVEWGSDANGNPVTRSYTVDCVHLEPEPACQTGFWPNGVAPANPNWSTQPTYKPDDGEFLRDTARVTVTSTFGDTTFAHHAVFAMPSDNIPRFENRAPHVEIPVGVETSVVLTEIVAPPAEFPGDDPVTLLPFYETIVDSLPGSLRPDLNPIAPDRMELTIEGKVEADDIGLYSVPIPVEGHPVGVGRVPRPLWLSLDVRAGASDPPVYRALLHDIPDQQTIDFRRNYPDIQVAVAHTGTDPDPEPYRGTVFCQVKQFDMVVHTEECGGEQPFPWPDQTLDGRLTAVVWLESDDQPVSPLAYEATVWTQMIHFNVDIDPGPSRARWSNVSLGLSDFKFHDLYGVVPTPFSAQPSPYLVECRSNRRGGFRPCLDDGTGRVTRTPGLNTLQIRVTAPDGAVAVHSSRWTNSAGKRRFKVSVRKSRVTAGRKLKVRARNLGPAEPYTVRLGGRVVGRGVATVSGRLNRSFKVPKGIRKGKLKLKITGVSPNRRGSLSVRTIAGVNR